MTDENKKDVCPWIVFTVILIVVCLMGYAAVKVHPLVYHRRVADRMDLAILRLADNCPQDLTDDQWAFCVTWTWNLHHNFGSVPGYVPTDDLVRIERGLRPKIDNGPDLATIDWIWDQYIHSSPDAQQYGRFRPTAPNNKTAFEAGNHGGNPLSQWRAEYKRKISQH